VARKEIKELLAEAERQGWRVKEGKHYQLLSPDGKGIVTCPKTPSSSRTIPNVVARMRRYGFVWKGR
jgi:hypothetical protein